MYNFPFRFSSSHPQPQAKSKVKRCEGKGSNDRKKFYKWAATSQHCGGPYELRRFPFQIISFWHLYRSESDPIRCIMCVGDWVSQYNVENTCGG